MARIVNTTTISRMVKPADLLFLSLKLILILSPLIHAHVARCTWRDYQSLYFVPFIPDASLLLKTSYTSSPPPPSESGASAYARVPHSAFPVIGSTGILRRNLIFVLPTIPAGVNPSTRISSV